MELNEYQDKTAETAAYPHIGNQPFVYPAMGLAGETGEILNKIKKIYRDQGGFLSDEVREKLGDEIGDVLWYVAQLATSLELELNEIALDNLAKLKSRKERGVLGGSGYKR